MADLSNPNDMAIDEIGILDKFNKGEIWLFPDKHPDGWIQAVIDRAEAEIVAFDQRNPGNVLSGVDKVDWRFYTADEKAAFEWYWREVLPADKWSKLVDDYLVDQATSVPGGGIDVDEFGENDHLDIDGKIPVPEVKTWTGGDNKDGELKVSTEAIRYFANSIGKIVSTTGGKPGGMILDVRGNLDDLNVLPGKFARAEKMRRKLAGGDENPGLIGDTAGLLTKIHQALFALRESLLAMANSYEYTEDGNVRTGKDLKDKSEKFRNMTEAEFAKAMGRPWGQIDDIGDYGQVTSGGYSGGDGGDKSDGDKSGGDRSDGGES
ncbi:hypothetical protein O7606_03470 [Micromonospora sp. WMMD882]|uniref:hypothetical protein n=1 Tax=Micromonospora sp. WMMD882 TaxID=3015151 RepID=UPI00248B5220|nr:hypothetical protein [Micromonospora sp. WMMD882]WBB80455.1 hypothetical protein O7606_03470 [Micromonospora sp. WMMD882]